MHLQRAIWLSAASYGPSNLRANLSNANWLAGLLLLFERAKVMTVTMQSRFEAFLAKILVLMPDDASRDALEAGMRGKMERPPVHEATFVLKRAVSADEVSALLQVMLTFPSYLARYMFLSQVAQGGSRSMRACCNAPDERQIWPNMVRRNCQGSSPAHRQPLKAPPLGSWQCGIHIQVLTVPPCCCAAAAHALLPTATGHDGLSSDDDNAAARRRREGCAIQDANQRYVLPLAGAQAGLGPRETLH